MALDGKQVGTFEGLDGTTFDAGRAFSWERDATPRMVRNAALPSNKNDLPDVLKSEPLDPNHFVKLGDNVPLDLRADLYQDPGFLAVSGHLDRDGIEGSIDMDGDVHSSLGHFNGKLGMALLSTVVDGHEMDANEFSAGDLWIQENGVIEVPMAEVPRGALKLAVAVGEKILGVSKQGRVEGKGGKKKATPADAGAEASM